jgi:hypothetical protein
MWGYERKKSMEKLLKRTCQDSWRKVSTRENFLGRNSVNKKYLKCPKCGKRGWAEILMIKK